MSDKIHVGVLIGSLREGSFTRKVARNIMDVLPDTLDARIIEIGDLPLYNMDLEKEIPEAWQRFRDETKEMDAFIFATPEYNRSVTAAMKNALDVGSVPYSNNGWEGKPAVVVSVSPGSLGGFGGNNQVRQTLACLGMPVMPQPEAYLNNIAASVDAEGHITNERLQGLIKKLAEAFAVFAARFQK